MRRIATLGGLLLAGAAAVACSPAKPVAPAHPSITGMWDYQGRVEAAQQIPAPPVTPAVEELLARKKVIREKGYVRNVANILCLPTGMPQMMQWKSPLEILETPGRVTILSEKDPGNDEPRTIYMDKKMPDEVDPSWNGYSVGHWEGKTLVVETKGTNDRGLLFQYVPKSLKTTFVERFTLSEDGKTLTDQMTITDPTLLTKPWVVTLKYNRMPDDTERLEAVCEPDLAALKETDLKALGNNIDVEATRMLDPANTYNADGLVKH